MKADLILVKGRFTTLDPSDREVCAVAVKDCRFVAVGSEPEVMSFKRDRTRIIDLKGSRVIPGLNDSHIHAIREGLNYNMELRTKRVFPAPSRGQDSSLRSFGSLF
jgi:hypothetical protein